MQANMQKRANRKEAKVKNEDLDSIRESILRPLPRLTVGFLITTAILLAVLGWSVAGTEANPEKFVNGIPTLVDFVLRLMPPEFEFEDGTERVISLSPFEVREIPRTLKGDRARKADEADIAAMTDGQTLLYVLRLTGADDAMIITPEEAENYNKDDVHTLNAYISEPGYTIVLDDWDESVITVEDGYRSAYSVPYLDGQMVVAKRYVLNPGEMLIGFPVIIYSIIETIQIAIVGTLASVLASIPFALLAARNVSPHPLVYQATRLFLNLIRSIPTLIYALIMVSAVGLGPFAGVLALVVGSIGSQAKLFAESFEQIDPNQVAAVRATGAGGMQVFNFAVLPQAFPLLATYSLITFEVNVRASTILGIVGAGGVGFIIQKYTALFQFQRLMGAVLIIAILVTLIDRVSDAFRKRII
ncbi:MAG: phosphonate ABC transporter, permease protein PhnE [Anaerolineae bacterium]|nr:phosphonate ABC transporter, permease protein PhnE [Anaerolineae bacterium]MCA9886820.1 phosphonate ABC transporter, permease protein PhnE [Anaerolineae bacterium]MCA9895132.1 phosphonate ABC transporter, permease protein PhnE [Anaerolineae bacterium]MCB9459218.1 phosphonate ABC transporter, permease protein PhnE [Anaerolineaceae bacterium]